ncbi:hypothetical protein [Kitasatospora terrestris]|uniref:Uncharacterized protein n=1 Tax=Kitasatospora terrestris TaxID=258051 RepID=A0ABP9D8D2_9ACTN
MTGPVARPQAALDAPAFECDVLRAALDAVEHGATDPACRPSPDHHPITAPAAPGGPLAPRSPH